MYGDKEHLDCGGNLTFKASTTEETLYKRKIRLPTGKVVIKKTKKLVPKELYLCDKCGKLVNVITFPSWKDYVLRGQIRVPKWLYWKIKKAEQERKQRKVEN